jgi:replicative DNA helicase
MQDKATLSKYGKSFQEKLIQSLIVDKQFAEQMNEVFNYEYLELKYLQSLSTLYFDYYHKYKTFPTIQILATIVKDKLKTGSDKILANQIVEFLIKIKTNPDSGDLEYVKEKSLDFCKKQALKLAIEKSIDLMENEKYEAIVDVVKEAVVIGTSTSLGHDFLEESCLNSRFCEIARNAVATGIPQLDDKLILNGGLGAGELGIILGCAGSGKSHILVQLGAVPLTRGMNVLHYTFELSEHIVGKRYDSFITGIDSSDLIEYKDEVIKIYQDKKDELGRLIIKYFPTGTASIHTIRNHVERCAVRGFVPDILIIDYPDVMRSTRKFELMRQELKLIYEEIRGYAGELKIPIWGGCQSNKDGTNSDVLDLSNMSEAYSKAAVADVVISLSRKTNEKSNGTGRLFVAKNRAGKDGLIFPIELNTAQSKLKVTGDNENFKQIDSTDETARMKKVIQNKLRELENVSVE